MVGYDTIALRMLMSDRANEEIQAALTRLATHARMEYECPECGSTGPHEPSDDGETALCYACGYSHEVED